MPLETARGFWCNGVRVSHGMDKRLQPLVFPRRNARRGSRITWSRIGAKYSMAKYADREAFIPFNRMDTIQLCIDDGKLAPGQAERFRHFSEILTAYYHFEYHKRLESLKGNFAPFSPDLATRTLEEPSPAERGAMGAKLVEEFEAVLKRANYSRITQADLDKAFAEESLIRLRMKVPFEDFEEMVMYYRDKGELEVAMPRRFRSPKRVPIETFGRVVLFLRFKDEAHFRAKGRKVEEMSWQPGKTYVYFYKNIPTADLEVLFPNLETHMNLKDVLMLGVPAVLAFLGALIKILPQIALVIGALLILFKAEGAARMLGVDSENAASAIKIWATMVTVGAVLGGVMYKQYVSYKSKQINLQKMVTETLFFKNLASNASVFHALIDAAEEEECKQILLVYYHLLAHPEPLTPAQLDDHIEAWMAQNFGVRVDFDIDRALEYLEEIKGEVTRDGKRIKAPLLTRDEAGACHLMPLDEACTVIDGIWDNYFQYANE